MKLLVRWPFAKVAARRARLRRWSSEPALVESLEARTLLSTYVVTSALDVTDADDGVLTLREAITAANATTEHDTIVFNIGSGGPQTIQPLSALPYVMRPLTIDGTSQPGYSGTPLIELDGSRAGSGVNGLYVTGGGSTIRGLVINRFIGNGILIAGGGGNLVEGNYIGTDRTGTTALANWLQGIRIDNSANHQIVGNTISGNRANGIAILYSAASGNLVRGNRVGTTADGAAAVGNGIYGVLVQGAGNNTVGGTADGDGNIISANRQGGVVITGLAAKGNVVQKNFIGTDAPGLNALGNQGDGIILQGGTTANVVGGAGEDGNLVAFNLGRGLVIADSQTTGNSLRGNALHGNSGAQFDPGPLGCCAPPPAITSAEWNGTELRIVGSFEGAANSVYTLDFFLSTTSDPANFSGGQQFLVSVELVTNASGEATFELVLMAALDPGQVITATAADSTGSISVFSPAAVIVKVDPPPPPPEPEPEPEPLPGPADPAPEKTPAERVGDLAEKIHALIKSGDLKKAHAPSLLQMLSAAQHELSSGRDRKALVSLNVSAINLTVLMRTGRLDAELGGPLLEELRSITNESQEQMLDNSDHLRGSKLRGNLTKALDDLFSGKKLEKLLGALS